jgi:hypothetical protein
MAQQHQPPAKPAQRAGEAEGALPLILRALQDATEKATGSFVVVNIATGEYVAAASFMEANTAFMQRFPGARGFAHRLGEPLFEPLLLER